MCRLCSADVPINAAPTAPIVIAKLNVAVVDALADPAVRRRIADQGM